ncbi:SAM-dependent methyltransferase [Psychromonas sp. Urea-02u-13]|nr:SAM-dependent methyltransferase [Psychromonas sp. Urea-02u-13]
MAGRDYDHIWDCCCDHGLLGFQLLKNDKAGHIHFVDVVAPLLNEIDNKLSRYYQGKSEWSVHCLDVATLPIAEYDIDSGAEQKKHLIIIAGIGGQLLITLLKVLFPHCRAFNVEFILSPVHHNHQLRAYLKDQNCRLIDEVIVEENKRFYEVLHIDQRALNKSTDCFVSLVGDKMWNFDYVEHQLYLQQTIKHYQRMAKNPTLDVSEIIKGYQDLIPCV